VVRSVLNIWSDDVQGESQNYSHATNYKFVFIKNTASPLVIENREMSILQFKD